MGSILIKNAKMVNEGKILEGDILLDGERISRIAASISSDTARVIDLAWSGIKSSIVPTIRFISGSQDLLIKEL